jgi:hypothetical protein
MTVDLAAASAYLKNRFSKRKIEQLSYKTSPAFAMIPKKEDFGGEDLKIPVSYADLKGRSADFAVAQANKQGSDTKAFLLNTVSDYAVFSVSGKAVKLSRGDINSFISVLEKETESAGRALGRSTSWAVFGNSVGSVATMGSNTTTTLTLGNRAQVQNFEVGMTIQLVDPASTSAARSGKLKIVTVNRDAGTLVCNVAITTGIPAAANDDLVVPEGDLNARASGFAAWIPNSAPTAGDSFFGVNRADDPSRLGGLRFNAAGLNIVQAIQDAAAQCAENGGSPDTLFINFDKWKQLMNYLGSQKEITQGTAYAPAGQPKADIGFEGVRIHGPNGPISVYADRHCQHNTGWLLQLDTWCLHSAGGVPMLLQEDGQTILREATSDGYEGRWGAYYQVYCYAPGYNCRIQNL